MKVHAEIMYLKQDGTSIHSDICPPACEFDRLTSDHRKFLHDCLDEWLDKSRGTGVFYIGDKNYE